MNPGGGSSLLEFPLPLAGASHGFCCEYDATLRSDASGGGGFEGPPGAGPLWACLRVLTVSADSAEPLSVGAGSLNEPSGLLSAKNAFLPPRQERQLQMRRALSTWLDEGFFSALESLASTSEGRFTTCWARGLEGVARALLATYRMTSNIHSSFNPHLMLSGEDMIARFSPNRDWFGSKIRVMAWHPHTLKLAVAFKTDQIQVLGQDLLASPTLKYKRQRGVACLAWRPLNGSELAVGCLTGLLIWTVDPLSVAARPSASCVNFLPTPPGHAPVTTDTSMILWNTASETKVPLRRVGGGGVHSVAWSPDATKVLAATPSTVFRVWDTINQWNHERWNVLAGHVNTACWSPCGSFLLFSTNPGASHLLPQFPSSGGSSAAAVPVADMSQIKIDVNGEVIKSPMNFSDMFKSPIRDSRIALKGQIIRIERAFYDKALESDLSCISSHVNTACWSPCGSFLLFSTNQEPLIYCLNFHPVGGSSAAAVPVADMSQIKIDVNGEVINIGGPIQSMKWNSMGERLAVSFKNSDCIALYCTTLYPTLGLSPIGLIQGLEGESPMTMEFAHKCDHGAILSVAWSSGRIQHIPLFYVPLIERNPAPLIINPDFEIHNSFHGQSPTQLFSTPLARS
ncbi:hypothetical protein TCAL_07069 [Tigriopus californicus]|uniref:Aladin seven-bladed propeller domain-containing protein n=1 Tax=Tigriopus californicus TaxID=6832 RepID=A0A553PQI3_TIGCA|nr:hypothetical protein TCAL_07069 [Tigriopus californicus]